jgi:hypothetical protein
VFQLGKYLQKATQFAIPCGVFVYKRDKSFNNLHYKQFRKKIVPKYQKEVLSLVSYLTLREILTSISDLE